MGNFHAEKRALFKRKKQRVRYGELQRRFIEHKQASGIASETLSSYLRICNTFGEFLQSDLFIDSITPEHIEKYIKFRRSCLRHCDKLWEKEKEKNKGKEKGKKEGKEKEHRKAQLPKPKSIRNEAGTLATLFKWAVDRDLVAENPMRRVPMPQKVVYDSQRALTPGEYLNLRAHIEERYRDILDLYLLTGLRRSDGLLVTSENFNFEEGVATFFQSKTRRHKTLPISNDLAAVVGRLTNKVGPGKPLIHVKASALTKSFRRARIKAGLPEVITFHSLMHTFASWLAQAGVDFKTLQSLTGHRSSQALEVYVHSFDPNRRCAIERLQLPKVS